MAQVTMQLANSAPNTKIATLSRQNCARRVRVTIRFATVLEFQLGLRGFLEAGNFKGFTTNFQVLHGLKQLPGLAVQRLMSDGYGFGGEGDWKTCALVRAMKAIAFDMSGGTSFARRTTPITCTPTVTWFLAHICSKFVSPLLSASPRWKSTRSALAVRKTLSVSFSMRLPDQRLTPR